MIPLVYAADFETTTLENDCRVWAWALCEVGNVKNFKHGKTIDSLMQFCIKSQDSTVLYFHNLKFDGEFILSWLFKNGYEHCPGKRSLDDNEFNTLISDSGQFYSIKICLERYGRNVKHITIYDSLKLLNMKVSVVAKTFDLPISKLEIDYNKERPIGYDLDQQEIDYIHNDVAIMSMALKKMFDMNLIKMTIGSNALQEYKKVIGKKHFNYWFPPPKYDKDIRGSYKGGFTYLKEGYSGVDLKEGIVLDVNSLYPSVMYNNEMPYGEGVFFTGKYKADTTYNLYVQMFRCQFEIKPRHIPTVQIKHTLRFAQNEYLKSSNDEIVTLCMTSVDIKLFFEHYDVYDVEWISGWKFMSSKIMFRSYIDKWNAIKVQATLEGNSGMRSISKLMLNSLYGKFATNPVVRSKHPYLGDDGVIHYSVGEAEERKPVYIPVGSFITSWARYKTITSAQKVYDRFVYADTDSLHLLGTGMPEGLEIDSSKLGAWKHESTFSRARFLRQKCYIEEIEGELKITCAGMPDSVYPYVTWDNFRMEQVYEGKLRPKHVDGGIVLVPTTHKLRT